MDKLFNGAKLLQLIINEKWDGLTDNQMDDNQTTNKQTQRYLLGDPKVTANIYCKSRNLPNTDTQNYSADLR